MTQTRIVQCNSCQTKLKAPAKASAVKCPKCKATLKLAAAATTARAKPASAAAQTIKCPSCAAKMKLPPGAAGKTVKCPSCSTKLKVPGGATAAPRPAPAQPAPVQPLVAAAPFPSVAAPAPAADPFANLPSGGTAVPTAYPPVNNPYAAQSPAANNPYAAPAPSAQPARRQSGGGISSMSGLAICGIAFGVSFILSVIPVVGLFAGGLIYLVAIIASMVGGIWLLVRAFQIDTLQGILTLFVPFYIIVLMVNYWQDVRDPALIYLGSTCALMGAVLGIVIQSIVMAVVTGSA